MKSCPKCGEGILNESSKFCPKCGIELDETMNYTNQNEKVSKEKNSENNVNKFVDGANNVLNHVVSQAKIEKNYIKYRLDDNNKTQVKGDEFILSEKIANTIEDMGNKKQKRIEKTEIKIEDEK